MGWEVPKNCFSRKVRKFDGIFAFTSSFQLLEMDSQIDGSRERSRFGKGFSSCFFESFIK